MAENKQVILDIKTNAQEVAQLLANAKIEMQQLKDAQKNLDELYKSGLVSKAAYVQQTGALSEQLTHCKEATQAYAYELKNNIKQEREQEGSIKSLRAELNNLLRAYDGLSRTERENAKGKEMLGKINELTKEIKGRIRFATISTERWQLSAIDGRCWWCSWRCRSFFAKFRRNDESAAGKSNCCHYCGNCFCAFKTLGRHQEKR